ncbi:DUF1853 family protein [Parvibium lacunae]|uniref:DUF1853 family protein n=1 Tax=Parvibium lacunae TaxID=1888893 RepID=A0A368L7B2_9BURK|nr:DUF1853 family protein [Parvibium lacunae]RCS59533.1 DUF1853 family protein [Parvibium lacunae]
MLEAQQQAAAYQAALDLQWLLTSPCLLNPAHSAWQSVCLTPAAISQLASQHAVDLFAWLDAQLRAPTVLWQWLQSDWQRSAHARSLDNAMPWPAPRLGRYAEALFAYFLIEGLGLRVGRNLPLREPAGKTLGELDLVWSSPPTPEAPTPNSVQHTELAVKFYVYRSSAVAPSPDFIGPRGQDRLRYKLQRLKQQLGWSTTPIGQAAIEGWMASAALPLTSLSMQPAQLRLPGRLFYPWGQQAPDVSPAWQSLLNPVHLRGFWYVLPMAPNTSFHPAPWHATSVARCPILADYPDLRWAVLSRAHWFASIDQAQPAHAELLTYDGEAIEAALRAAASQEYRGHAQPAEVVLLVAALAQGREVQRGIVFLSHA